MHRSKEGKKKHCESQNRLWLVIEKHFANNAFLLSTNSFYNGFRLFLKLNIDFLAAIITYNRNVKKLYF